MLSLAARCASNDTAATASNETAAAQLSAANTVAIRGIKSSCVEKLEPT
jgi:hypothetical protein